MINYENEHEFDNGYETGYEDFEENEHEFDNGYEDFEEFTVIDLVEEDIYYLTREEISTRFGDRAIWDPENSTYTILDEQITDGDGYLVFVEGEETPFWFANINEVHNEYENPVWDEETETFTVSEDPEEELDSDLEDWLNGTREEDGYTIYDERDGECHRFDTLEELSEEYSVRRICWDEDDSRSGIYMDLSEDDWNWSEPGFTMGSIEEEDEDEENPLPEDWLNGTGQWANGTPPEELRTLPENGSVPEL